MQKIQVKLKHLGVPSFFVTISDAENFPSRPNLNPQEPAFRRIHLPLSS